MMRHSREPNCDISTEHIQSTFFVCSPSLSCCTRLRSYNSKHSCSRQSSSRSLLQSRQFTSQSQARMTLRSQLRHAFRSTAQRHTRSKRQSHVSRMWHIRERSEPMDAWLSQEMPPVSSRSLTLEAEQFSEPSGIIDSKLFVLPTSRTLLRNSFVRSTVNARCMS